MKLLIFASPNGDLDLINETYSNHPEVEAGICLGDLCLASSSTPIKYFLRTKFRHQADNVIEANKNGFIINRPTFFVYGSLDDPFIPSNEMKISNFMPHWRSILNVCAVNDDRSKSKNIKIGLLSGYLNTKKFKINNLRRAKMSRERQSLALCAKDFEVFNNAEMDIFFSYESPYGYPKNIGNLQSNSEVNFGSKEIAKAIERSNAKLAFCGHHRASQIDQTDGKLGNCKSVISVPELSEGYFILDLFDNSVTSETRVKIAQNDN